MSTYIPLDQAQAVVVTINALEPPISPTESAKVAYATTPATENVEPDGDRDYYAVWPDCGFSQNCATVQQRIDAKIGDWAAGMRQEYADYMRGHEPASQYGLPEGVEWTYVE